MRVRATFVAIACTLAALFLVLAIDGPAGAQPSDRSGGTVWLDENGDGLRQDDEPGIARTNVNVWTVDAFGAPNAVYQVAITDATGQWTTSAEPGDYIIQWVSPAGTAPTTLRVGEENGNNASPNGLSDIVTIRADEPITVDAGFLPLTEVLGVVFDDLDRDGVQQAGEDGIQGANVSIFFVADDGVRTHLGSALTSAEGTWKLTGLPAGDYVLDVLSNSELSLPDGFDGNLTLQVGQLEEVVDIGLVRPLTTLTLAGLIQAPFGGVTDIAPIAIRPTGIDRGLEFFPVAPGQDPLPSIEIEPGEYTLTYSPDDSTVPELASYRPTLITCDNASAQTGPTTGTYQVTVEFGARALCNISFIETRPTIDLTIINAGSADLSLDPMASEPPRYVVSEMGFQDIAVGEQRTSRVLPNESYTISQVSASVADTTSVECTGAASFEWQINSDQVPPVAEASIEVASEPVECTFVYETRKRGDVNCDGRLTILDASIIAQRTVGLRQDHSPCPITPATGKIHLGAADTNNDRNVNILDAFRAAECSVGLTNSLCPVAFD